MPLETFFNTQLSEWPMAHAGHEALTHVWSRPLASPKLPMALRVQCNPARIVSTGASIDKASIAARPCFLCAANRPKEQRSIALNGAFEWLVNPFPILRNHYTIASTTHRKQSITEGYEALIQATKALPEEYIVFYNGPKCGASAPDHLHLQAGIGDDIPLVKYAKSVPDEELCQAIAPFGYMVYLIHDAEDSSTFDRLYAMLPLPEGEYEPRMNVVAYRKGDQVDLIVIPRHAHRPHCYAAEGDARYLISPGALDMCGLIVTPRAEDYERLTAAKAMEILCEVGVRIEPTIDVGIMQGEEIEFEMTAPSASPKGELVESTNPTKQTYMASIRKDAETGNAYIVISDGKEEHNVGDSVMLESLTFSLHGVTIGKEFHWQQQETQTFQGALILRIIEGELHAINRIAIEDYLTSVIASEMSGTSSVELLKAHAVISRSWLLAQIKTASPLPLPRRGKGEAIRWYDREAHTHFDVCADDHCQRYQGISRKVTPHVHEAIRATRGIVLSYDGEVCDARFSKCCGGITELYESCWDDTPHPYLSVVHDPFCNTNDPKILSEVLNHYDQGTDFYRWTVQYTQEELSELVRRRSGFDYGEIVDLIPIERGPSGRIVRLQIVGTKATRIIGKELEIRRTLSDTHLYSSAFEVEKRGLTPEEKPLFALHGRGWGHGVGLCQIGAAVMGAKGYKYDEILHHYYPNAELTEWYE
ncbi:MAG: DUF4922 domain-containing protein [Bacteroidaceae bacterium]|nr:DUF4922 domain-containing protein [Bacteroidaceae bacterium]